MDVETEFNKFKKFDNHLSEYDNQQYINYSKQDTTTTEVWKSGRNNRNKHSSKLINILLCFAWGIMQN